MESTKNRDPALCSNAVQEFWDNERELIKQGQGTRDWTIEQQKEILNLSKNGRERKHAEAPTDENGKAYQGHHMKSAEKYPDYQDKSSNIQALTYDEHRYGAHKGNTLEPTNGFYNPDTGEMTDFGESPPVKPEPIKLSQSYIETEEYKRISGKSDSLTTSDGETASESPGRIRKLIAEKSPNNDTGEPAQIDKDEGQGQ